MGFKKGSPDIIIFFTVMLLLALGIIMVFSASYYDTLEKDPYFYVRKQMTWGIIGVIAMIIMMKIDYFRLKPLINLAFVVTLILLVLVLIPHVGVEVKGSRRWINLGFTNLQPSEIMKLCMVMFVAKGLSRIGPRIKNFMLGLGPYLLLIGLVGGLIMLEPDLGTTVAIAGTTVVMLFAAGTRWAHLLFLGFCGVVGVAALIIQEPYRLNRIIGYLDPWAHASKEGYQTVNSLYALGSGGLFGMGLGNSRQKLDFLPEQHTDFIFAILGEELGFVGAFFVILLFFLLAWRGYRIALTCPDAFGSFLAVGITTMIVSQAFMNMGVVTGLLPVTGISLPFISYGGSSLLFSMVGIGILLNISRYSNSP
ncbi:MAG: putative lipid II flippase FtsW [Bacillota bacterium]|uniref:Probable peptidoglycan glycosyltransferase FtsW n=1 Tax=Thermanaerosceptrum fracticalcis TaxID=1712410 RepID=A0A7G6DZJ8_THEFR|nr:putative lipid II flippase FtsW [Thermanaerosceptrum fracticalcis]QNB45252.1 putative lipid II flippase FtsW [Thermanaerosceptrum fracticalcis]